MGRDLGDQEADQGCDQQNTSSAQTTHHGILHFLSRDLKGQQILMKLPVCIGMQTELAHMSSMVQPFHVTCKEMHLLVIEEEGVAAAARIGRSEGFARVPVH